MDFIPSQLMSHIFIDFFVRDGALDPARDRCYNPAK